MMDLVFVGRRLDSTGSEELQYAENQLLASLPAGIATHWLALLDPSGFLAASQAAACQSDLPDSAGVLLLQHSHVWLAPSSLTALGAVLEEGASGAFSYDSTHPLPACGPDYLTVRGIERYACRLAGFANEHAVTPCEAPLVWMTRLGNLRRGDWRANAQWAAQAFAHDFSGYHQGKREDVIPLVPPQARRVLDVGGGEGGFLAALKAQIGCETHLAEFSGAACDAAQAVVDHVWQGDYMVTRFDTRFDCISFLDVLEHTTWPAQWLKRAAGLLQPGGCIVLSIPNVGHWSVVADLLEGRWDYAAAGIHCISHLRFFTQRGVEQLLAEAGFVVEELRVTGVDKPPWFDTSSMGDVVKVDSGSLNAYAFLIRARPVL